MSTRGSFGYIINDIPVLFYNHFDSYPVGLGNDILNFISKSNLNEKWSLYRNDEILLSNDLCSVKYNDVSKNNDFIKNSLFCEFAYVINFDNMTLEFYNGYQKKSQIGNRFGCDLNEGDYYPCRLVAIFDIDNINDSIDIENIINRMDYISENDEDDISIEKYFRRMKLDRLNKKTS